MTDLFYFTVTDLARFLGKAAVTIRGWERKGIVTPLPRDESGDRKLSAEDIRYVAQEARAIGRISEQRLQVIEATVTLLALVERENNK